LRGGVDAPSAELGGLMQTQMSRCACPIQQNSKSILKHDGGGRALQPRVIVLLR